MNKKDNARSRSTDERITRALYVLLESKKSIAKVSVREICEIAGINRSTFYAHYLDVYDLLEKVENTMERRLTESFLDEIKQGSNIGRCFLKLFEFIREYREFYKIYLSEANHPTIGIARELYKSLSEVDYAYFGFESEEEVAYQEDFSIGGLTALVRRWIEDDCRFTPEELNGILERQYTQDHSRFDWSGDQQ